jgi:hypothetical protein
LILSALSIERPRDFRADDFENAEGHEKETDSSSPTESEDCRIKNLIHAIILYQRRFFRQGCLSTLPL